MVETKFESSYSAKPQSSGGGEPSDKQPNFINKLLKEVPKSVSDPARSKVDNGLTGLGASQLIKSLLEERRRMNQLQKTLSMT